MFLHRLDIATFNDRDLRAQFWMVLDQILHFSLSSFEKPWFPERAASCYTSPFAGYVVLFDVRFDGVDIFDLECCNFRCSVEQQWLAVAAGRAKLVFLESKGTFGIQYQA